MHTFLTFCYTSDPSVGLSAGNRRGVAGIEHGRHHHRFHTPEQEQRAATIFTCLFMLMIVAQMLLVYWKKKRYRSYQQVTLFGLWLIPFLFAEFLHFYKLLACWLTWTAGSSYIMYKATRRPVPDKTPRLVYSFFFYSFRVCYSAGLCGYLLILLDFFQLPQVLGLADRIAYYGGLLFFFGLYFGVLSRDCSEMCTDRMAATMGYGKKGHMPNRRYDPTVCLLCGDALNYDWALMNSAVQPQHIDAATIAERTVSLSCGHAFHDFCIRCVFLGACSFAVRILSGAVDNTGR